MTIIEEYKLLEKNKFRLIPYMLSRNELDALQAAKKIGYPIAMKIIAKEASHKTEVGGVRINIKNDEMLRLTVKEFEDIARTQKLTLEGILIQKMARKGLELIIGAKKDPQFGHMIVLGLGGIYVEIFRDVSARLCPITEKDIEEMIDELKSHPVIRGARGKKSININALKHLMLQVCAFVTREDIKELDLNPVIFDEKGGDLVDVRMSR